MLFHFLADRVQAIVEMVLTLMVMSSFVEKAEVEEDIAEAEEATEEDTQALVTRTSSAISVTRWDTLKMNVLLGRKQSIMRS